jgi:hypothetical protein
LEDLGTCLFLLLIIRGVGVLTSLSCSLSPVDLDIAPLLELHNHRTVTLLATPPSCSNGDFEMTTPLPMNSFVNNSALHILPTLTALSVPGGNASVFDGYTYNATGCTSTNFEGEYLPPPLCSGLHDRSPIRHRCPPTCLSLNRNRLRRRLQHHFWDHHQPHHERAPHDAPEPQHPIWQGRDTREDAVGVCKIP